ncbi:hypothetical protein BGW38_001796 [Lunasporangiospora selenospora]|uniref:Uncharacterized protein n=1 Tax=Lunasporangiospora selenospora TaxID=979761 RepID=A0A9P6FSY2_9FUNG|nr:hypothetical protein BGW38_001796 [Lunasporangiospora selenospora]
MIAGHRSHVHSQQQQQPQQQQQQKQKQKQKQQQSKKKHNRRWPSLTRNASPDIGFDTRTLPSKQPWPEQEPAKPECQHQLEWSTMNWIQGRLTKEWATEWTTEVSTECPKGQEQTQQSLLGLDTTCFSPILKQNHMLYRLFSRSFVPTQIAPGEWKAVDLVLVDEFRNYRHQFAPPRDSFLSNGQTYMPVECQLLMEREVRAQDENNDPVEDRFSLEIREFQSANWLDSEELPGPGIGRDGKGGFEFRIVASNGWKDSQRKKRPQWSRIQGNNRSQLHHNHSHSHNGRNPNYPHARCSKSSLMPSSQACWIEISSVSGTVLPVVLGPFVITSERTQAVESQQTFRIFDVPQIASPLPALDRVQDRRVIMLKETWESHVPQGRVWDSAFVMMAQFKDRVMNGMQQGDAPWLLGKRILDLSAGTGILGLYIAALAQAEADFVRSCPGPTSSPTLLSLTSTLPPLPPLPPLPIKAAATATTFASTTGPPGAMALLPTIMIPQTIPQTLGPLSSSSSSSSSSLSTSSSLSSSSSPPTSPTTSSISPEPMSRPLTPLTPISPSSSSTSLDSTAAVASVILTDLEEALDLINFNLGFNHGRVAPDVVITAESLPWGGQNVTNLLHRLGKSNHRNRGNHSNSSNSGSNNSNSNSNLNNNSSTCGTGTGTNTNASRRDSSGSNSSCWSGGGYSSSSTSTSNITNTDSGVGRGRRGRRGRRPHPHPHCMNTRSNSDPNNDFEFDLIIASDVIYDTNTFDALLDTLYALCVPGRTTIYVGYKHRGLDIVAEQRFFDRLGTMFIVQETQFGLGVRIFCLQRPE